MLPIELGNVQAAQIDFSPGPPPNNGGVIPSGRAVVTLQNKFDLDLSISRPRFYVEDPKASHIHGIRQNG